MYYRILNKYYAHHLTAEFNGKYVYVFSSRDKIKGRRKKGNRREYVKREKKEKYVRNVI